MTPDAPGVGGVLKSPPPYDLKNYCIEIWGNASAVQLDALIKIQKNCVRTISFSEFLAPTHPLFERLNILKFDNLVIHRISL